jgi:hypothetical protein
MSNEEKRDLTGENVHGIKNSWSRFGNWNAESDPEPEPEPVVEEPTPEPEPEPEPTPVQKGEDWVSGTTLNNMADHLRRAKRLKITIEQAKELILNDEATKVTYQNHQNRGKF